MQPVEDHNQPMLGFNSKGKEVELSESSLAEFQQLINAIVKAGIEVRGKKLRGAEIPAKGARTRAENQDILPR